MLIMQWFLIRDSEEAGWTRYLFYVNRLSQFPEKFGDLFLSNVQTNSFENGSVLILRTVNIGKRFLRLKQQNIETQNCTLPVKCNLNGGRFKSRLERT